MIFSSHPTAKFGRNLLLVIFLPALFVSLYSAFIWYFENTLNAEVIYTCLGLMIGSGGLSSILFYANYDEIKFCDDYGISEAGAESAASTPNFNSTSCSSGSEGGGDSGD